MTPADPEDRDMDAAEFVLGTLAGEDRTRLEAAATTDPALQRAVYEWQDRLLGLAGHARPRRPDAALWSRIEARLSSRATAVAIAANDSVWNRVATWRAATGFAIAASIVLVAMLALRAPPASSPAAERFVAVLQSPEGKETGWLVEGVAGEGVRLLPMGGAAAPPGKSLQFWTKPAGASGPTSLGLVDAGEVATVPLAKLPALGAKQLFEVTLEPAGGSTTGRPTGPILYVGTMVVVPRTVAGGEG